MTAGFGAQANALLRKSATYQKRNVRTNICLLSSPIFFCLLLLFIKVIVDKIFLSGTDYECGCQCTSCCKDGSCEYLKQGYCDEDRGYKCQQYDKNKCGLAYSSPIQASWCQVQDPSIWPPVMQVPRVARRARPANPGITLLITAPDPATSPGSFPVTALGADLITMPQVLDNATFLSFMDELITVNGTVNGYLFTKYGYTFGSAADPGQNQYIERAFAQDTPLNVLLPAAAGINCTTLLKAYANATGLNLTTSGNLTAGRIGPVPLLAVMAALVDPATPVTEDQVDAILGSRPVLADFLMQDTICTDAVLAPRASNDDIDNDLYCGFYQSRCNGSAVTSEYPPATQYDAAAKADLDLVVYYNETATYDDNGGPGSYIRLQQTVSNAVTSWWVNMMGPSAGSQPLMGIMSMPKRASKLKLDFSNLLGPLFYTWVVQMLLPTFLQQLVYEKEKRLRMMMQMHGLGRPAYWLITYLWYLLLYIVYMLIFTIFGAAVGLEIFRRTAPGIQVIFYFLFGNNMIAFSFMLSSFFSSSRTATVVAFIYVFATGLIGELLLKVFMQQNATWVFFIEWIPAFALYRGLWEMAEYAFLGVYRDERGLTWDRLSDKGNGMMATWGIFAVEWVVFMLLGWYLEQVLSSGNGIRRHPLYFLECCFPKRKRAHEGAGSGRMSLELAPAHANGHGSSASDPPAAKAASGSATNGHGSATNGHGSATNGHGSEVALVPGEREDVRAERLRVEGASEEEAAGMPILIKDLRKVYPPLDGGKPKVAVRTLTLGIERGECFGLLGPNGAGKSTAINMLTGFLEPNGGTAIVEGYDIRKQMASIYRIMGVCPQHDLLWEQLTGEEHLYFYGRLKGLKGPELASAVETALKSVNLFNGRVGQKQAAKYSGGMKRRLSVAISFMGAPQVVYLDEPSTGLDPASRRNLWDVVRRNKAGRATILTTHSMEEAEVLCDRLGIFVDGQLVCIGAPREITSRYAGYLVFTITVAHGDEDKAKAFVGRLSPGARLTYELGTTLKYELPTADVTLAGVFDAVADAKRNMQVLDWGVANATLEEVFIKFARDIGAETKDA